MTLRIRKLSRSFDPAAFEALRDQKGYSTAPRRGQLLRNVDANAAAAIDAPVEVSANEFETDLQDVVARVRAGALTREDLVNDGTGWTTLGQFYPLEEALDGEKIGSAAMPPEMKKYVVISVLVTLGLLAAAAVGVLR